MGAPRAARRYLCQVCNNPQQQPRATFLCSLFFFDNLMPEFELRLRISAYPFYDLCLLFGMRYIFVFRVSSTHKLRHLIATGAKGSPQNTWDLTREEHFYTPHVFAYLMQLPKGSLPLELAAKRKRIQRYPSQTVSLSNGN